MMTFAKSFLTELPSLSDVIATLRGFWSPTSLSGSVATPSVAQQAPTQSTGSVDRSRYARLLEHELDRQHLTDVEREDSAMLDRVRDALYADE